MKSRDPPRLKQIISSWQQLQSSSCAGMIIYWQKAAGMPTLVWRGKQFGSASLCLCTLCVWIATLPHCISLLYIVSFFLPSSVRTSPFSPLPSLPSTVFCYCFFVFHLYSSHAPDSLFHSTSTLWHADPSSELTGSGLCNTVMWSATWNEAPVAYVWVQTLRCAAIKYSSYISQVSISVVWRFLMTCGINLIYRTLFKMYRFEKHAYFFSAHWIQSLNKDIRKTSKGKRMKSSLVFLAIKMNQICNFNYKPPILLSTLKMLQSLCMSSERKICNHSFACLPGF